MPIPGEHPEDSRHGWFSDPVPLSESTWLCSYTPTVVPWHEATWALYVADRHGNLALIHRDPAISCAEPVPVVTRPVPHVRAPAPPGCATDAEATLFLADVFDRAQQSAPRRAEIPARARRRAAQERSGRRRDHDVGHADFHHQACDRHGADRGRRLGPFRRAGQPQHVLRSPRQGAPGNPADAKRGLFEAG